MYDLTDFVDKAFKDHTLPTSIETSKVAAQYEEYMGQFSDLELVDILITSGYIPDMYGHDSKEETLYTKLCEVLEVVWAKRIGLEAGYLTQKSSYEDVYIVIDGKTVVSDTKSFRLARSQKAPNVKDFVKPEDYQKWIARYSGSALGGLVVYPQLHEWTRGSDAHAYCSNKANPIVMLPFHYLAFLLKWKTENGFDPAKLANLWDFGRLFPAPVKDRVEYWRIINDEILNITGASRAQFIEFLKSADKMLLSYVEQNLKFLSDQKKSLETVITNQINQMKEEDIRQAFLNHRIEQETGIYDLFSKRVRDFRLSKKGTAYTEFVEKYEE